MALHESVNNLSDKYIILHFYVTVNICTAFIIKYIVKVVLIISERKRPLTEYGMAVKVQLLKLNKTQTWLIEEVKLR